MPKEDLIKLAEALDSMGYKITTLNWEIISHGSPYIEVIKLEIIKRARSKEQANKRTNPD